ncbi:hypothetical protein DFH06DRAFT_1391598 [Mycena polygramma]|nr:hypothetical protein DFH06DRAFT_1391598 [Mycena polygramma]
MHRALDIPEIVENVCQRLSDHYLYPSRQKDFAFLARCCKAFHGPAANVLWKEQETLANVLRCLPSYLWEEEASADHNRRVLGFRGEFRLIRAPLPEEWERCLIYGRRIRQLSLTRRWDSDFPTFPVLQVLGECFQQDFLCPNLQSIQWVPKLPSSFPYIRLFLGPKISGVYLTVPPVASDVSLLSDLGIRYAELKQLKLGNSSNDHSPLLSRISPAIVLQLAKIEYLSVETLDRQAFDHLSRLPSLVSLVLRIPAEGDIGPTASPPIGDQPSTPFPALRRVNLGFATIEFATELTNMLPNCHLREFRTGTDVLATNIASGRLYAALASHISHTTLDSLTIAEIDDGGFSPTPTPPAIAIADYVVNGSLLAPLFCFRNITDVHLKAPVGFDLDDATAWDMARAWRRIQFLQLDASTELHHPTSMTLHGIRAFAKYCEDLATLKITVNATTVPPFDRSPETRLSQQKLRTFDVLGSHIAEPYNVARFLSALFPCLVKVITLHESRWRGPADDEEELVHHTQWKQVQALLPVMTAVREEERHWTTETKLFFLRRCLCILLHDWIMGINSGKERIIGKKSVAKGEFQFRVFKQNRIAWK